MEKDTLESIDWDKDTGLCIHVVDYMNPLGTQGLYERLVSIVDQGLLTAKAQGRDKNGEGVTPVDVLDVWSPLHLGSRGNNPKEALSGIVKDMGTFINLLLRVEHEEYKNYPHSIARNKPQIVAFVIRSRYLLWKLNETFREQINTLATKNGILILDSNFEILK